MGGVTKYWLDKDNVIVDTNDYWDTFAEDNDGKAVLKPNVIGKKLLTFISSDATRMLVEALVNNARITKETKFREYRCDSPNKKRFMEMRITPLDNGMICVENEILKEETLTESRHFVTRGEGKPFLKRCSVCNKINDQTGWYEPDHPKLARHFKDSPAYIAYSVCSNCNESMKTRIASLTS